MKTDSDEFNINLNPHSLLGPETGRAACFMAAAMIGNLQMFDSEPAVKEWVRTIQLLMLHGY